MASHASLSRDLRTTTGPIDCTVEAARRAGAIGARMTGAGLGKSVLVLIPTHLEGEVLGAVTDAATRDGFLIPRPIPSLLPDRAGWSVDQRALRLSGGTGAADGGRPGSQIMRLRVRTTAVGSSSRRRSTGLDESFGTVTAHRERREVGQWTSCWAARDTGARGT